jgi:2-polyprenyl-6-methoxyphenol hydroxylase-like FAD-dependent oxidoreductase
MRILIVGAGIAGLTLAFWLEKDGHDCVVIEKAPDIRTQGYMIDFGGTGWDVADRMGLIGEMQRKQQPITEIQYKDASGATTAQLSLATFYKAANVEGKFMVINRRDIVQVLYEAVREKVKIRFGTALRSICQSDTGVTAAFEDGTGETFDALIGADGIHSTVRRLSFGEESRFAAQLGYRFSVFQIPRLAYDLGQTYQMYVEPGVQVGLYPYSADEWLVFVVQQSAEEAVPPQNERARTLREQLPKDRWIIGDIAAKLTDDTHVFMDTITQIELPQWANNRVALIGDAAYCPSLVSGQGASMAMAGAYFLAQELNRTDIHRAFRNYENRLRSHIGKIQKSARDFAPNFVPRSRFRIRAINWVLRMAKLPLVSQVIGKQVVLESIIDTV